MIKRHPLMSTWFRIRNLDTKSWYSIGGVEQYWTSRESANHFRDKMRRSGHRYSVYRVYRETVGSMAAKESANDG